MTGEIAGKVIQFRNPKFLDDPYAGDVLADLANPQIGKVSLFSFDPHPLLSPHPYFEWFSESQQHCRIELEPDDAWVVEEADCALITKPSQRIHETFVSRLGLSAS